MKIRSILAAGTLAAAALGTGAAVQASQAGASAPVVSTTARTVTLISPKCIHYYQVTRTYMHWSTAQQRYVRYSSVRVTVTSYNSCH